jgi:hypothetical protein
MHEMYIGKARFRIPYLYKHFSSLRREDLILIWTNRIFIKDLLRQNFNISSSLYYNSLRSIIYKYNKNYNLCFNILRHCNIHTSAEIIGKITYDCVVNVPIRRV